ncbi:MAG: winged helix-turn-helix domain-containing protein [Acidimicrobiia bacterium]|nr:winged helix-turn-helix domain-containing protein [Acidimicrobiia bacterium]
MEFRILGPLEVVDSAGAPVEVPSGKTRSLLLALLVAGGDVVPTDSLVERLWGGSPPADPENALQVRVSQLRRAFGADRNIIVTSGPGYRLRVEDTTFDVAEFEVRREVDAAGSLALWRGPVLADVADEDWARPEITRLEELRLTTLEQRIEADLGAGRHDDLVGELRTHVADHPYREGFRRQLMLALYRSGRHAEALREFEAARVGFEELGLDPGPELREIEAAILRHDGSLRPHPTEQVVPRSNLPVTLTSFVGRVEERRELEALVSSQRLVTIVGPGGAGKTRLGLEVAESLTPGFGGGVWFVDLAPLRPDSQVAGALAAALSVAAAPGPSMAGSDDPAGDLDRVLDHLEGRTALVVMDNCEHVLESARRVVMSILARCRGVTVLATSREPLAVPGEHQWPIGPLPVPPPGTALDEFAEYASVQLFVERASAVRPQFSLMEGTAGAVVDICRRLDGLPLAIELAAARVKTLAPGAIAARLDDRFALLTGGARTELPRHRTLQAVIEWSYDLLDKDERALVGALSVFAGGATLESVEHVCADVIPGRAPLIDVLGRLVDKSLVTLDASAEGRYRMLETLRVFAADRLRGDPACETIRLAHARRFADVAGRLGPQTRGPAQHGALDELELESENLTEAFRHHVARADIASALRMWADLAWGWGYVGRLEEAVELAEEALAPGADIPPSLEAECLAWLGFGLADLGRLDAAVLRSEASLRKADAGDDARAKTYAELLYPFYASPRGLIDPERAMPLVVAGLTRAHAIRDDWAVGLGLFMFAFIHMLEGNWDEFDWVAEESRSAFERAGNPWGLLQVLQAIEFAAELRGRVEDALACRIRHADLVGPRDGHDTWQAFHHGRLAWLLLLTGDTAAAVAEAEVAIRLAESVGSPELASCAYITQAVLARGRGDTRAAVAALEVPTRTAKSAMTFLVIPAYSQMGFLAETSGDMDAAEAMHRRVLGASAHLFGVARCVAHALEGLAGVQAAQGNGEQAAFLLGAARGVREAAGMPPDPVARADIDRIETHARGLAGPSDFASAFTKGMDTPSDQVVQSIVSGT